MPAQTRLLLDPTGKASHENAEAPQLESLSVPTSDVRQGDVLRVLPGERLPVDGVILSGRCSVDESMLTGEATLVPKKAGQEVQAPDHGSSSACMLILSEVHTWSALTNLHAPGWIPWNLACSRDSCQACKACPSSLCSCDWTIVCLGNCHSSLALTVHHEQLDCCR